MTFTPGLIADTSYSENTEVVISILGSRPDITATLESPLIPGKLYGYYNPMIDAVELYIVNANGYKYLRVI